MGCGQDVAAAKLSPSFLSRELFTLLRAELRMSLNHASMDADRQKLGGSARALAVGPGGDVSWLHRFAAVVAILGFFGIVLGSRGLSAAPDARLALLIRNAAAASAVLLACWIWLSGSATYLKILGSAGAILGVAAALGASGTWLAGVLAGAAAQPLLGNGFYGVTVSAVLFTRTDWRWDGSKTSDLAAPSFRQLSVLTTAMIFAESVLGAAYEAGAVRLAPHMVLGVATAACALWMLEMALNKFAFLRELKIAAILAGELVLLQIFIGLVTYSMALNARAQARPLPGLAVIGATHAAAAALALAASLFTMFEAFKYLSPRARRNASGTS